MRCPRVERPKCRLLTAPHVSEDVVPPMPTLIHGMDNCSCVHIFRCPVLPHIAFWLFLGFLIFSMFSPGNEFWPFLAPPSPLTFHDVKNHGSGSAEGEPGRIARNEEQKKQRKRHKTNRNKTTKKDRVGPTNLVRVFSQFRVLRCFGCLGCFRCFRAPKMAKILGGVKFQHFGPPLRPKNASNS